MVGSDSICSCPNMSQEIVREEAEDPGSRSRRHTRHTVSLRRAL